MSGFEARGYVYVKEVIDRQTVDTVTVCIVIVIVLMSNKIFNISFIEERKVVLCRAVKGREGAGCIQT